MALALQVGMEEFYEDRVVVRRGPSPGIAAVLSVIVPGLGQVYNGQLGAGLLWFLVTSFGYWAILVPGFLFHVLSVYFAYRSAKDWRRY
jgi:TM2 domain-containing membrane protein YozV